jgi:hypothetical protein
MPLSRPAPREHIHSREIRCRGYRCADGLWDIEGVPEDTKPVRSQTVAAAGSSAASRSMTRPRALASQCPPGKRCEALGVFARDRFSRRQLCAAGPGR